jgi:hypothetical protein
MTALRTWAQAIAAAAAFFALLALAGCDTIGQIIRPLVPPVAACEPSTGQTYAVRIPAGERVGHVERAAAPDPACVPPAPGALRLEARVLCRVSDGQSLAVGWDPARNEGAVYVSSTKLPGCTR